MLAWAAQGYQGEVLLGPATHRPGRMGIRLLRVAGAAPVRSITGLSNTSVSIWADARVYLERPLIIVLLMGFASGLPLGLTTSTLSLWLNETGVTLTAIGLFALVGTPYNLKFLWAPLIDRVPLPVLSELLGRRRAWMLVIQFTLLAAIVVLGSSQPDTAPMVTAVAALAVAFLSASQDIVIDAYRIEILDDDQQGAGAAMTQAGYRLGAIMSGAGALYLAHAKIDWSLIYFSMGALVIVGMVVAWWAPSPKIDPTLRRIPASARLRVMVVDPFLEFFTRNTPGISLTILVFILLYKLGDAFLGVMAYPFYARIGFSYAEIATASKLFGVGATLVGVFVGGVIVKRYGILKSLLICGILQMMSNLMFAAQAAIGPDFGFLFVTIGVENLSGGMGGSAFVAYLSLLCNINYTGTQYALFSSLMAFGRTWLSVPSGWVADKTDWVGFFLISTGVAVPGLLLLIWMMLNIPTHVQTGRIMPVELKPN